MFWASFIGFLFFVRSSSGILHCAMTFESCVMRKMALWFCLIRHLMESFPHFAFWFFQAETSALKNLSASTSYFTVRSARYSVG